MNRESERKRLVEKLSYAPLDRFTVGDRYSIGTIQKIADHLLDNGIGIKPPIELCRRRGDYIFVIDDGEITEGLLCLVHYNSEGEDEIVVSDEWSNKLLFYKFADYGKTVFPSREDAVKALKERKMRGNERSI